ncbi:MAG: N-formylglutamate amidohydrolase, partial [Rhodospirillales bacterium]
MAALVVHVPHASLTIPDDAWPEFLVARAVVEAEALASADLYTHEMARQAWPTAKIVEAEVSRIVVDVERYDDDSKEEMAEVGRGVFYVCDHQMQPIRRALSEIRRVELLDRYYRPHWERLRAQASDAILIDLHTYPSEPWPIERLAQGPRPEIDIGFSDGLTPLDWVEALADHFRQHGYDVGYNTPYVGVIDAGAKAATMIEIRRDIV